MSRRIDEVQFKFLTAFARIGQVNRLTFDGNASFSLDIHIVQDLVTELPCINEVCMLDEAVGKRGFTVVNVGNNAEISNLSHNAVLFNL